MVEVKYWHCDKSIFDKIKTAVAKDLGSKEGGSRQQYRSRFSMLAAHQLPRQLKVYRHLSLMYRNPGVFVLYVAWASGSWISLVDSTMQLKLKHRGTELCYSILGSQPAIAWYPEMQNFGPACAWPTESESEFKKKKNHQNLTRWVHGQCGKHQRGQVIALLCAAFSVTVMTSSI